MKRRLNMKGLAVEFEGEEPLVDWAAGVLVGARLPPHLQPGSQADDAKTPNLQNITHRGVKTNDGP
jgi:hypothetical protein